VLNSSQSWFLKPSCSWIIGVEDGVVHKGIHLYCKYFTWPFDQFIYLFSLFYNATHKLFLYWNHSGWRLRYQYMRTMIVTKPQIFGSDIHDPTSVHFGYMSKMPCNNKSMLKSLCYGLHSHYIIHSTCKVQVRKTNLWWRWIGGIYASLKEKCYMIYLDVFIVWMFFWDDGPIKEAHHQNFLKNSQFECNPQN
jgi:hypothetical protein